MKSKKPHFGTCIENKMHFHKSHAAKAWETGRPSRRMEAEVSSFRGDHCTVVVHDVSSKGEVKNRSYKLIDINECVHKILCDYARDKQWRHFFALVNFFREQI
jgi:hypothetical protein